MLVALFHPEIKWNIWKIVVCLSFLSMLISGWPAIHTRCFEFSRRLEKFGMAVSSIWFVLSVMTFVVAVLNGGGQF